MKEKIQFEKPSVKAAELVFANDPLTLEQQIKIIDFAFGYAHALLKNSPSVQANDKTYHGYNLLNHIFSKDGIKKMTDAEKIQLLEGCDKLPFAPLQFEEESFFTLYNVLNHPELKAEAFGLDKSNPSQLYAARMLIKSTFESQLYVRDDSKPEDRWYNQTTSPYYAVMTKYRDNLCCEDPRLDGWGKPITAKHKLLMQNDPLIQLSPDTPPSALDVLLAYTHFQTGTLLGPVNMDIHGKITREEIPQDRERYRMLYIRELTRLYNDPKTHTVMTALAGVLQRTGGNLLFSMSSMGVGDLAGEHNVGFGTAGFYDHKNSIISSSFIAYHDHSILPHHLGTVAHEGLHFIFDHIVGSRSSPVKESDAAALDLAIQQDRDHRGTLNKESLSRAQRDVWQTVVAELENERTYIGSTPAETQRIMRAEIIVRPIEKIVEGTSEEDVEKIMPNVYRYFKTKSMPLIEEFNSRVVFENPNKLLSPEVLPRALKATESKAVSRPDSKENNDLPVISEVKLQRSTQQQEKGSPKKYESKSHSVPDFKEGEAAPKDYVKPVFEPAPIRVKVTSEEFVGNSSTPKAPKMVQALPVEPLSIPPAPTVEDSPKIRSNADPLRRNKELMDKIELIFTDLKNNIDTKRKDVKLKTEELMAAFDVAKEEFSTQLSKPHSDSDKCYDHFKQSCETAINDAAPILKKDLSLLNRVLNFFKKLFGLDARIVMSPNEKQLNVTQTKLYKKSLDEFKTNLTDEPGPFSYS